MVRGLGIGWVVLVGACAAVEDVAFVEQAASSTYETQGMRMQGMRMQGMRMQGMRMQGMRMQGMRMQGVGLEGTAFAARALVPPPSPLPVGWTLGGIGTCAPGASVTVSAPGTAIQVCRGRSSCAAGETVTTGSGAAVFHCPGAGEYTVLLGADAPASASTGQFPLTVPVSGLDFIGATIYGVDAEGIALPIVIEDIRPAPDDPEVLLYTLVHDGENLCEPDAGGLAAAIPMRGVWDDSGARQESEELMTFGCTSGVLAKCVRWGYKPWKTVNGMQLAGHHQACTRMARADYCGNGRPHTQEGTVIDVYDNVIVQHRTAGDLLMLYEASWTEQGAYCISKWRWDLDGVLLLLECPSKVALPSLADLLAGCAVKLSSKSRSAIRTHNDSYLGLSLLP